ncbi:unnamed protein product [Adineta steineri]|uniref:Uncharacterized protein n=1 Tax=Adineta steineri TaxID=433720 RepID=A0A815R4D9_9BILA|nr:unnamed protein product [Adineta steineri]
MGFISRYGNNNNMTSPMDRLYDGISEQINILSNELRQMSANTIRENSDCYVTMLSAVSMLAEYENKGLLYIGGVNNKNKKNEEIIEEHHNKALSKSDNKKLIYSLDNKESEIVVPDRDEKFELGNPRGTLRLDCQDMVDDGSLMNLQIQYGRDKEGRNGSYANAILPSNHYLGRRIITNNTLNCYLPAKRYINFRSSLHKIYICYNDKI